VLYDPGRRSWFGKTLPCSQAHASKQAKKDRANQGQVDEFLLS
jgi:hypothetical protein